MTGVGISVLGFPALAAGPYDGVWRGQQQTVRKNSHAVCESLDHAVTLRIVDSRFSRRWGPGLRDTIHAEVKPDGTLFGSTSATADLDKARRTTREYVISGRISNGVLEAEIGSSLCGARWTLKRG